MYDREAGLLLDHIEIFMDMIQRGNYKEASYVAACSPKGVLRNMETLLRFKGEFQFDREVFYKEISALSKPANEDISPWLFHCTVLAETALEAPFKPDMIMSLECAKAACTENHLNLLYKWIAEERCACSSVQRIDQESECFHFRLTCSYEMAELVQRSNAFDLAEFIYRKVKAHYEVACCLLQTGVSFEYFRFVQLR